MDYFTKRKLTIWVLGLLIVINLTALVTIYVQSKTKIVLPGITTSGISDGYEVLNKELDLSQEQADKIREIMDEHRFAVDMIKEEIQENRLKVAEELLSESPDTSRLRDLWENMGSLQTKLEKLNALHFLKVRASVDSVQKKKFLIVMREMQDKNKDDLENELVVIPERVREQLRVLDTMRIIIPRIPNLPQIIPDKFDEESMKKYELNMEKFGKDMEKYGKDMEKLEIETIEIPHIYVDPEDLRRKVVVVPEIKIPKIKIPKIVTPDGEEEIEIPEIVIPEIIIPGLDPQKQEEIQKKIDEKMKEVEKKLKEKSEKLKEKSEKLKEKNEKLQQEEAE